MNISKINHHHIGKYHNGRNKILKKIAAILVLSFLIPVFNSCSADDNPIIITVSDINQTIDEHPENDMAIGAITTNMTGDLNYTISSETVSGAFSIDSKTGLVSVGDRLKFDYETNTTIGATVSVSNSSETKRALVSVTLNNIDDIAAFLTASKTTYNAATNGDWIKVTVDEYVLLASVLNEVTKSGATDDQYNFGRYGYVRPTASGITMANDNGVTMPENSYCFAFRYRVNADNTLTTKVKTSNISAKSGFSDLGSALPTHDIGHNYFVLKGNNTPTTKTGYLAIYSKSSFQYEVIDEPTKYNYTFDDVSELSTVGRTDKAVMRYQGLSTTQKQWD